MIRISEETAASLNVNAILELGAWAERHGVILEFEPADEFRIPAQKVDLDLSDLSIDLPDSIPID